jgi:1-aminocyclopropane-1-carboxylate deaminase
LQKFYKMGILRLPSPVVELHSPLFTSKGIEVFVKREDLIHPQISGNKWRKLQGWLSKAQELEANTLVSFGGAYSNHLLALAAAGMVFNKQTIGIVRGEEQVDNLVLFHCRLMGMQIKYVTREEYRHKEALFEKLYGHTNHLMVPEGGGGEPALQGFQEFVNELEFRVDHIVVAAGTGYTAYGLAKALQAQEAHTIVHAIACVKDKSILEGILPFPNLSLEFEFAGKGFGKIDSDAIQQAQNIASEFGFLLEPIYTLKAWKAMIHKIEQNQFEKGSKILFVHTGGLNGWWSF